MELIQANSAKSTHPRFCHNKEMRSCLVYKFSTGHKYSVWTDGTEFFNNAKGRALNPAHATKVCEEMRRLAKAGIQD